MELKIKMLWLFTEDILGGSAIAHPGSFMASPNLSLRLRHNNGVTSAHFESMPGHMENLAGCSNNLRKNPPSLCTLRG
jgi:hypothetical protein